MTSLQCTDLYQSSLTLALLRCIITEGTVYYDGIATNTINLDALRSNITIIPQTVSILCGFFEICTQYALQPELLSGKKTSNRYVA